MIYVAAFIALMSIGVFLIRYGFDTSRGRWQVHRLVAAWLGAACFALALIAAKHS